MYFGTVFAVGRIGIFRVVVALLKTRCSAIVERPCCWMF